MKKLIIVLGLLASTGCAGLYSDSVIHRQPGFQSQSWSYFEYPGNGQELAEFVANTDIYQNCINEKKHALAIYQEGIMGDLTVMCENIK